MACPIGVNAHIRYIKDWTLFAERMVDLRPAAIVAMVDKDEHIPYVLKLADDLRPIGTLVVGRVWVADIEGQFHLKPAAPGDERKYIVSPADALNAWGVLGDRGKRDNVSLYLMNEPSGYNADWRARLCDWWGEAFQLATARHISLVGPNFATGHPELTADGLEWTPDLDRLLHEFGASNLHYLGLHEYLPGIGVNNRVGRVQAVINRCNRLGIKPPRVLITEAGYDSDGKDQHNGYKSRNMSGTAYANIMIETWKRDYEPLKVVLAMCVFSYGDSGGWGNFDTEPDAPFWAFMTNHAPLKKTGPLPPVGMPTPAPEPAPLPIPLPPPAPTPEPEKPIRLTLEILPSDLARIIALPEVQAIVKSIVLKAA